MDDLDVVGVDLTERQREMLRLVAVGYDVEGIAGRMAYSVGYTYAQLGALRESLGAATNAAAVVEGLRLGVIGLPGRGEMVGGSAN